MKTIRIGLSKKPQIQIDEPHSAEFSRDGEEFSLLLFPTMSQLGRSCLAEAIE
jgi:hypothetical protein